MTLVVQTADDPIAGLRGVFWLAVVSNLVVLALVPLLPGKVSAPEPVREGAHA
ncbi:hypothetical protein GCM10023334_032270 [Nonomuraea thailandensis]